MPGLRHQRFTLALASGYLALLGTVGYSFLLVPLSLSHVSLAVLGLWFLALQACRYLELIDLGVSGASLRLISQAKFNATEYRKTVFAAWGVLLLQGLLIAVTGCWGAGKIAAGLVTDGENQRQLAVFIFWVFLCNGVRFALRIFPNLLRVNQLQHQLNLLTFLGILANLAVLAAAFVQGCGSAAFLWGFLAEWFIQTIGPLVLMLWQRHLPHRLQLAWPGFSELKALSRFGLAVFQMNSLRFLLETAPMVLAGRFFGPEASAVWSIVLRAGTCLRDLLAQIHISAAPAFYDLLARGERLRLNQAFTRLSMVSLSLGAVMMLMFAAWDSSFVRLWTSGKCLAPPYLPALLAGILWVQVWNAWVAEASVSLFRTTPLARAFLQEAVIFCLLFALVGRGGLVELAAASLLASLTSSVPRGMILFRELWDASALSRSLSTLLGYGSVALVLLWLSAVGFQALAPPVDFRSFIFGVLLSSFVSLAAWGFWLRPPWLIQLSRGLLSRPS